MRFNWREAKKYIKHVESKPKPKPQVVVAPKSVLVRGKGAFHPSVHCDMCSKPGDGLKGIRFRCIHCACFNVCSACEPTVGTAHDTSHVFELIYETDFDW